MKKHFFGGVMLAGVLVAPMAAQMQGYLDIFVAKVKMGKRAEFDSINKRMVEINRKTKGDNWLAYELTYGTGNTVYFVSTRPSYSGAEEGTKAFEGALAGSLGKAGMQRMFNEFDATLESEHTEFRRRRMDLSASVPADAAAYNQLVGKARFIRVVTVRTRPGKALDYEAQLKLTKEAQEQVNPGVPSLVSQSLAGGPIGVYYISNLVKSLSDLDEIKTLQEVRGSSYAGYLRTAAESVIGTEIFIGRFLPEISNPPEEIAAVDMKFWRPAPAPVAAAKAAEVKK